MNNSIVLGVWMLVCLGFLGGFGEARSASSSSATEYSQTEFPKPEGHVNDFAGIIPQQIRQSIEALCREVEQKTGTEIAVVTVKTVGEEYPDEYANKLFEAWGIGKKGKDNGVLLFNAVKERRLRIEVGYGLEGILPDGLTGDILRKYVLPHYRKDRYGQGLLAGTRAIAGVIAQDAGIKITGSISVQSRHESQSRNLGLGIFFLVFFLPFLIWIFIKVRGNPKRSGYSFWVSGWDNGGSSWSGGGGSFGGGFGGFGGGMSGGGGAGASY